MFFILTFLRGRREREKKLSIFSPVEKKKKICFELRHERREGGRGGSNFDLEKGKWTLMAKLDV